LLNFSGRADDKHMMPMGGIDRLRVLVLLAAALALAPCATARADEPLRVVSIPWREPAQLAALYRPTLDLLGRKLGRRTEFFVARNYDEVTRRMEAGAADLGIYGPASYVLAKRKLPQLRYLATCKVPDDHYYSLVIVRRDAPWKRLAELKGRIIGLTDPESTSGYLVPRRMFADAGVDLDRDDTVFLLKRHYRVYDALAQGTIEAGAAHSGAWNDAEKKYGPVFRVLARSEPLPREAVVAAPHVHAPLARRVQEILASAAQDPQFAAAGGDLKGYVVRSDAFYDAIRKLAFH
jgi:phosphonate transport system substrate-binding protein